MLLSHWLQAGASIPFTFAQLAQDASAGAEVKELVLRLLGDQKELWYHTTPIEDTDLIPRQAVIALLSVLGTAKAKYDARDEIRNNASATSARFTEQHKKRRRPNEDVAAVQ